MVTSIPNVVPDKHEKLVLSELITSLSKALDMTEGQPRGHCIRACWIGLNIGKSLNLTDKELWDLYYTLLLKDLGCSSNAARICQLYATDDLSFKKDFKSVDGSISQVLNFILQHTGINQGLATRFKSILNILKNGDELAQELIQTRCERGAEIAKSLRFGESVCSGIRSLDEHWDGNGRPCRLTGDDIPLFSRIALISQVIDVFNHESGAAGAIQEINSRSGTWFDPTIVDVVNSLSEDTVFWEMLNSPMLSEHILEYEPATHSVVLDDDYLDQISAAFGQVIDSKSPYTAGHSERVAFYTELICRKLGLSEDYIKWLRRGALLHDIGKLGVSNSILDKPGRLTDSEMNEVKLHAAYTEEILREISAFSKLSIVSGAHHEKLDGTGYPRGLVADDITLGTRIITTADIFDAITAERPYREAIPIEKALNIMKGELGVALDEYCFNALLEVVSELDIQDL